MATAAERTELIQLVVGMFGAAPGADVLTDLEATLDAGASISDIAVALSDNALFSGDAGLFPGFLPNAIFSTNFVTSLIGDEVSAENLQAAIDAVTGLLNAGQSRGEVVAVAIAAIAAIDPADANFGAAASALANKTEVAEYYSVTVAQQAADLDDLIAVLDGVDSDDASVDTATDAVDDEIAANADLSDLIDNLEAAETAKADFLEEAGETEADIGTGVGDADLAIDGVVTGYDLATDNVKAALLADQEATYAGDLATDQGLLADALDADTGTASVSGLDAAIATLSAQIDALDAAIEAAALTDVALTEAEGNYDVLNGNPVPTTTADPDGLVTGLIVASGSTLALDAGITEATDPGVDALLAADIANETADGVVTAAEAAVVATIRQIENIDAGTAVAAELVTVDALMTIAGLEPAVADSPTQAEISAYQAALDAGVAQLSADIDALVFDTDDATTTAAHDALTAAAVAAGFIDGVTETAMNGDFAAVAITDQATTDTASTDSIAALDADNLAIDFTTATDAIDAAGYAFTAGDDVTAALAESDLALLADTAADDVATTEGLIETLAGLVADKATAEANVTGLAAVNDAVTAAEAAFADGGFAVPVELDSAVKAATAADDVFIEAGIDSQIIGFGATGDDLLFIGEGLTLNADTTAGDNGDNSVLEVWVTASGSDTVVTIETSVFGSDAETPETYDITLTGVAVADVTLTDGLITVA